MAARLAAHPSWTEFGDPPPEERQRAPPGSFQPQTVPIDKVPVDFKTEARLVAVAGDPRAIPGAEKQAITQRISLRSTMRFDPENTAWRSKHEMAVQLEENVYEFAGLGTVIFSQSASC